MSDDDSVRGAIVLEPEISATVAAGIEAPNSDDADARDADRELGAHVDAIAVRPRHRGNGIGSALIKSALDRNGRLTAHFDASVRPFYEALGFETVPIDDERYGGIFEQRESERTE